ncbi:MAG: preprotein translocase subunit SecG [candidate division Zixibacteria bacterium]|nr:preprotein translocase subunit SecG [candidate division Zixibacteria bacterium]MDD5425753.1 preprotein translocase subunit SecG [candidate division Zixibacteria bacterium]
MFVAWVIFHVIVCIALILVVLMQSSKGEGLAGTAFSSGLSGAVFGGRGAATFLSKATSVLAIVFMLNCGALAFMSSRTRTEVVSPQNVTESVVTREAQKEYEQQMQHQQQQMATDSAAQTGEPVNLDDLMNPPPDSSAGQ